MLDYVTGHNFLIRHPNDMVPSTSFTESRLLSPNLVSECGNSSTPTGDSGVGSFWCVTAACSSVALYVFLVGCGMAVPLHMMYLGLCVSMCPFV